MSCPDLQALVGISAWEILTSEHVVKIGKRVSVTDCNSPYYNQAGVLWAVLNKTCVVSLDNSMFSGTFDKCQLQIHEGVTHELDKVNDPRSKTGA